VTRTTSDHSKAPSPLRSAGAVQNLAAKSRLMEREVVIGRAHSHSTENSEEPIFFWQRIESKQLTFFGDDFITKPNKFGFQPNSCRRNRRQRRKPSGWQSVLPCFHGAGGGTVWGAPPGAQTSFHSAVLISVLSVAFCSKRMVPVQMVTQISRAKSDSLLIRFFCPHHTYPHHSVQMRS
jgi:hypothetical protein